MSEATTMMAADEVPPHPASSGFRGKKRRKGSLIGYAEKIPRKKKNLLEEKEALVVISPQTGEGASLASSSLEPVPTAVILELGVEEASNRMEEAVKPSALFVSPPDEDEDLHYQRKPLGRCLQRSLLPSWQAL
jgi:hypothetical protein